LPLDGRSETFPDLNWAEKLNQKPIDPEWYLRSLRPASWQRNFEAKEVDREQAAELEDLPVDLYAGIEACKLFQPREFLGLLPQLRGYVCPTAHLRAK
jgi:hypothetical protein